MHDSTAECNMLRRPGLLSASIDAHERDPRITPWLICTNQLNVVVPNPAEHIDSPDVGVELLIN